MASDRGLAGAGVNRSGFVEGRAHAARRDQEKQFVVGERIVARAEGVADAGQLGEAGNAGKRLGFVVAEHAGDE